MNQFSGTGERGTKKKKLNHTLKENSVNTFLSLEQPLIERGTNMSCSSNIKKGGGWDTGGEILVSLVKNVC